MDLVSIMVFGRKVIKYLKKTLFLASEIVKYFYKWKQLSVVWKMT